MNARAVLQILDDLAQEAYASGVEGPAVDLDAFTQRILELADRTWAGEAKAAYDQAVVEAGNRDGFPTPDFWVARAQAAAAIEAAEQSRLSNLIAWKALQSSRADAGLLAAPLGGDIVTEQIEDGLGIA